MLHNATHVHRQAAEGKDGGGGSHAGSFLFSKLWGKKINA